MSTQYYNDSPATSQPRHQPPRPRPGNQGPSLVPHLGHRHRRGHRRGPDRRGSRQPDPPQRPATSSPAASSSASARLRRPPPRPTPSANPAQPTTPASPAVVPSASVKKLQQELGQLNYYEGAVDGVMGPQTTAAIKDLQRQANLPQDRHHERRHPGRPEQLPGPRQQPDGRLTRLAPFGTTQWPQAGTPSRPAGHFSGGSGRSPARRATISFG